MKKIFTSISLAAVTCMATIMPAAAQQQQLTDEAKVAFATAIVPEMFNQVKLISGIDFMALATPNIETVISSPLFGTQSLLKAATPTAISIQPDSMRMDLSKVIENQTVAAILKDIKLTFGNYKEFDVMTAEGRAVNVSIPQQIVASVLGQAITLNIKIGDKSGLLPFSSLEATVDFGGLKVIIEQMGITGTDLIKMTETTATGVSTYNVTLGDCLRSILKTAKVENADALPNFKINVNMATIATEGTINASLLGVFTLPTSVELPMGDAKVFVNKTTASADSIILTSYTEGTIKVSGYRKIVSSMKMADKDKGFVYATADSTATSEAPKTWNADSFSKITTTSNQALDPKNLMGSIFTGLMKDIMSVKEISSFQMDIATGKAINGLSSVMTAKVTTSITGTLQNQQGNIKIAINKRAEVEAETEAVPDMTIDITLPIKGNIITAEFTPKSGKVGTMYIKSNAMQVVTSNEASPVLDNLNIYTQENGIYVENGDNSVYSIVGMNGAFIAKGKIAGSNEYIATPSLVKGNIYIITIDKDNARKSFKFKAK